MSSIFEKILWFVLWIFQSLIIIFCNIIGLIIFTKRARHSRPCLLLANQCIADLLVGIEIIYSIAIHSTTTYKLTSNDVECQKLVFIINSALWIFSVEASYGCLGLISLERAYAIFRPFKHRVLRKKTYIYGIVAIWSIAGIQSLISILPNCYRYKLAFIDLLYGLAFTVFLSAFLLMIISYLAIYIKLKFFPIFQNTSLRNNEIKLCRTLFYTSLASVVIFLPYLFVKMYIRIHCIHTGKCLPHFLTAITELIFLSNSYINFVIYAWKFPSFVGSAKKLLCCRERNEVHYCDR